MTRILPAAAAASIFAVTAASASPQIPTPANPYPDQPVATDGSPLPAQSVRNAWAAGPIGGLVVGRSAVVTPRR